MAEAEAPAVAEPQTAATATEQKTESTPTTNGNADKTEGSDKPTNGDAAKTADNDADDSGRDRNKSASDDTDSRHPDRRDDRRDGGNRRDNRDRWSRDDDRRGGRGGGGRGRGRGGRGRGRGDYNDRKRNVRTHFERQEESSDATEIRRQVEFYFSDSNLPVDTFLLNETGGSENKPFPLKTIHNFKRMRHFQPFSAIVEAVKNSDFLEVNDKDEVYRKEPLDSKFTLDTRKNNELLTAGSMARSVYAKGFGEEKGSTAFDIEEFFQPYGVKSVRLRRQEDGTFKGSVFVEFVDEDTANQFLQMENKPKFEDKELQIMSKKAYVDMKSQAILDGTVKPRSPTRGYRGGRSDRRGRDNGGYNKRKRNYDEEEDDVDKDNWRERRDRFQDRGRGRGRGRDDRRGGRDRSASRSRSRSPYRGDDKNEKTEEAKPTEEVNAGAEATKSEQTGDKEAEKTEA